MPSEKVANLAETTLASSYTSGGSSISVVSAAGFPTTGVFRVRLGNAGKTIFRVDSVSGTTFTGGAEANDANASAGDTVVCVATRGGFERLLQSPDAGGLHAPSGVDGADLYGPLWKLKPLDQSGWAWVNQGGATVTQANGLVRLLAPTNGATNLRVRKVAAPSQPYTITAMLIPNCMFGNVEFGVLLRESATGKLVIMGLRTPASDPRPLFSARKYNSETSFNSQSETGQVMAFGALFLRVGYNNTNVKLAYSMDGVNFTTRLEEAKATFFTTAPDEVGIEVGNFSGEDAAFSVASWDVVGSYL